jgi:hypothetical protein
MAARRPKAAADEAPVVDETATPIDETEEAPSDKSESLRVTAPLVQVILGKRAVQFYKGDVLPDGLSSDSVEHLKSLGYVESDSK